MSKPSIVTLPRGRRSGEAVPSPNKSHSARAAFSASRPPPSPSNDVLDVAPPMLTKTFLPRAWHFRTSSDSSGQVASPGATVELAGRFPGQIHRPKSTVG